VSPTRLKRLSFITLEDSLGLLEVVRDLSYVHDQPGVTGIVRHAVRSLIGADGAAFVLREGELVHYVDEDAVGPLWKGRRFPIRSCISGQAMLSQETIAIPDVYQDSRVPHDAYRPTFVRALAVSPVRKADPIAAIGAYWADVHAATQREVALLEALADATATALENTILFERITMLNEDLEHRVEDRTHRLLEVCGELDHFAHSVSHDLKAPLRSIQGFSDLLLEEHRDELTPDALACVERIRSSTTQMSQLIEGLLAYARLSQVDLHPERVELDEVVVDVLSRFAEDIRRSQASVQVGRPLPRVLAHRMVLTQVVENLLTNALKFVAPGVHPVVKIRPEQLEGRVRLWVEDNGIGIAAEDQARIFRGFERLHSQREYPGSGVGLSIVRRAVERMGGSTGVFSEPGKGSRFWIELPEWNP
jgi:signal transduction histidine kinase